MLANYTLHFLLSSECEYFSIVLLLNCKHSKCDASTKHMSAANQIYYGSQHLVVLF